jgi:glycosyltransferase involved in cell wall biosynthesis
MKKIKVLHISETFVSGVYTYIKQVCSFLEHADDIESYVIYSGERDETDRDNFSKDFSSKVHLIEIPLKREITPIQDLSSLIKIIIQLRKIKPDIVHLHSSKAGVLGRVARLFYPKAVLFYTPHGYSFIREDISSGKKFFYAFLEKMMTKLLGGTIIACGDSEWEEAQKIGKSILIRNGVDIDFLREYAKEPHNKTLTIGTCSRISIQKNPELFNEIALELPQFQFVWVGSGDLVSELTAPNIIISGWKKREEVLNIMSEFDVFISTSLWEGLPFNIIEAMALSKPIIASNINGNKITVENDLNGYICDTKDDFVRAILKFQDKSHCEQMGLESLKKANSLFNMRQNFKSLEKIYRKKN